MCEKTVEKLNTITKDYKISEITYNTKRLIHKPLSVKYLDTKEFKAGLLDLNSASIEELDALPSIGLIRAEAIVNQRRKMGGFYSVNDILCVKGIGLGILNKIEDMVCVSR